MWKPERLGLVVLGCGTVAGFITGGPFGLVLAAVCLVVGLVLLVTTEAMGIRGKRPEIPAGATQPKSQVLFHVKEVHARPQIGGRFQEIHDPNQTDLEFEVFANCWMVNDTDDPLLLKGLRIWLRRGDGSDVSLKRIKGDLERWRLGRLRDDVDTWGVRYIQAGQELMTELNLEEPLQGGVACEGWIHFRVQNVSPDELKKGAITVSVQDSRGRMHVATAKGPHQVPGRIWPFQARAVAVKEEPSRATSPPPAEDQKRTEAMPAQATPAKKDGRSTEAAISMEDQKPTEATPSETPPSNKDAGSVETPLSLEDRKPTEATPSEAPPSKEDGRSTETAISSIGQKQVETMPSNRERSEMPPSEEESEATGT